ncbi:MAG TPA: hypothetical protein VFV41_14480 [Streptosporangiaceae bacterium]|nr:hypothetical protein [Streptosporangiaceae bacterium]
MSSADLLREAVAELYASDPDVFIARRRELVAHAREAGDKAAAQRIAGLHKPTRSAWLVNQLCRAEPQAADQLSGLGEELQAAQDSLDGAAIRDLSRRRRELLDELTRQVFGIAGLRQPPAALRDEVTGTLGAAMSDPGVAADLRAGTLTRAVQRAGLGDQGPDLASALAGLAAGAPGDSAAGAPGAGEPAAGADGGGDTTVVRLPARRPGAGRDGSRSPGSGRAAAARPGRAAARGRAGGSSAPGTAKRPGGPVSELAAAREKAARERRQQAIAEADRALAAADRAVRKTSRAERDEESAVRELEAEAEDARRRLAEARQRLSGARAEAQRARASQRRAQQALAKAQR